MGLRKKILIVEDNEFNRALLVEILSSQYETLEAENGKVGLEILEREKEAVSLILLDIVMPVMNGYEFLDALKANPLSRRALPYRKLFSSFPPSR